MKIQRLTFLALTLALLVGCGTSTGSESQSSVAERDAGDDFVFLTSMGVDTKKIPVMSGRVEQTDGDDLVALTDSQVKKLLNDVYHFDMMDSEEGLEGGFYIAGARSLPGGHTLVLFHIEYGDGSAREMAVYDTDGEMTDFLDTGAWQGFRPDESNNDYTHGKMEAELVFCVFDEDQPSFTLKRDLEQKDFTLSDDNEWQFGDSHWVLLKDYRYDVGDNGRLVLVDTKVEKKGTIDEQVLLLDDIGDLNYMPASDSKRMAKLAAMLQQPEIRREWSSPESMAHYRLQGVMQAAFEQNGQAVLAWIANNRSNTQVIDLLKSVFSSGWVKKDRMIQELGRMPVGSARKWLEEVTAQWGPEDAVG